MSYLFFDIECANCAGGAKICEFGYVVSDEQFNIIDQGQFVMDPDCHFDWYALKKILTYKKAEYRASPKYPEFYERISKLFFENKLVVGHATENDANYLKCESIRYNLPFIDFTFYDMRYVIKHFFGAHECTSLENAYFLLYEKQPENMHRAVDDARTTMELLSEVCRRKGKDALSVLEENEDCKGYILGGNIQFPINKPKEKDSEHSKPQSKKYNKKKGANIKNVALDNKTESKPLREDK